MDKLSAETPRQGPTRDKEIRAEPVSLICRFVVWFYTRLPRRRLRPGRGQDRRILIAACRLCAIQQIIHGVARPKHRHRDLPAVHRQRLKQPQINRPPRRGYFNQ